jgi:hypothetical protein
MWRASPPTFLKAFPDPPGPARPQNCTPKNPGRLPLRGPAKFWGRESGPAGPVRRRGAPRTGGPRWGTTSATLRVSRVGGHGCRQTLSIYRVWGHGCHQALSIYRVWGHGTKPCKLVNIGRIGTSVTVNIPFSTSWAGPGRPGRAQNCPQNCRNNCPQVGQ